MKKEELLQAFHNVKKNSPKRKFTQSYELIITLKGLNMKNPDNHVDIFVQLPHGTGKPKKVCALVGAELKELANKEMDHAILADEFSKFDGKKKEVKKLANSYDYFVAQANMMAKVAKTFGRVFGPRGRMPNPKAGCVVPPNANLKVVAEKLRKTVRAMAKVQPVIQVPVGTEAMSDDEIIANVQHVYSQVLTKLPQEENNVKEVFLKKTMGPASRVGGKKERKGGEGKKVKATEKKGKVKKAVEKGKEPEVKKGKVKEEKVVEVKESVKEEKKAKVKEEKPAPVKEENKEVKAPKPTAEGGQ